MEEPHKKLLIQTKAIQDMNIQKRHKFINMRYPNEVTKCPRGTRLYDPTIARFMSADSIIPFQYDTQAFNRYSYVKNNPLKYTDPSGHS